MTIPGVLRGLIADAVTLMVVDGYIGTDDVLMLVVLHLDGLANQGRITSKENYWASRRI